MRLEHAAERGLVSGDHQLVGGLERFVELLHGGREFAAAVECRAVGGRATQANLSRFGSFEIGQVAPLELVHRQPQLVRVHGQLAFAHLAQRLPCAHARRFR